MHPYDLLKLARTTKTLRNILMSRSAITIWRTALQNVANTGLPEVPPDLTEPEFVNLAFDPYCHVCVSFDAIYSSS